MAKFFITFLSMLCLAACSKSADSGQKHTTDSSNAPDQIIVSAKVSFVDSNFTKAILYADSGFAYSKKIPQTVLRHNVRVEFFSAQKIGQKISTLVADSVIIFDETKDMIAQGKVMVNSEENSTSLSTSVLQWDNKTRKLFSSEYIKILSPNEILEGYGFESDEKLSYYKIFKVKGIER